MDYAADEHRRRQRLRQEAYALTLIGLIHNVPKDVRQALVKEHIYEAQPLVRGSGRSWWTRLLHGADYSAADDRDKMVEDVKSFIILFLLIHFDLFGWFFFIATFWPCSMITMQEWNSYPLFGYEMTFPCIFWNETRNVTLFLDANVPRLGYCLIGIMDILLAENSTWAFICLNGGGGG